MEYDINTLRFNLIKDVEEGKNIKLSKKKMEEIIFEGRRIVIPNRILRKLDLSKVSFNDKDLTNTDLSYTNAKINPQKIYLKDLSQTNLEGVNLNKKSFDEVLVIESNLTNTKAKIDPQKVKNKSLCFCNLKELDMKYKNFDDVNIIGTNLVGTNASIDPQKIYMKSLMYTNLEGIDLSCANMDGVNIDYANLKNTNAFIDFNKTKFNKKTIFNKSCYTKYSPLLFLKKENRNYDILNVNDIL